MRERERKAVSDGERLTDNDSHRARDGDAGAMVALLWRCRGSVVALYWRCGGAAEPYGGAVGALALCWRCRSAVLALYSRCAGAIVVLC